MMKITEKIISIPPHISTSWDNIEHIYMRGTTLVFTLTDMSVITIEGLPADVIEEVFSYHVAYMESKGKSEQKVSSSEKEKEQFANFHKLFDTKFLQISSDPTSLENIGQLLQHNPSQAHFPKLPEEICDKIRFISKMIPTEDILGMPEPVEDCNCMYCQITRTLKQIVSDTSSIPDHPMFDEFEEEVSDADLHFEQWVIKQIGEKIYTVTNKLEPSEQYTVHLGEPVGCTCGKKNCEHLLAVLRS